MVGDPSVAPLVTSEVQRQYRGFKLKLQEQDLKPVIRGNDEVLRFPSWAQGRDREQRLANNRVDLAEENDRVPCRARIEMEAVSLDRDPCNCRRAGVGWCTLRERSPGPRQLANKDNPGTPFGVGVKVKRLAGSVNAERQEVAWYGWLAKRSALLTEGLPVSYIGSEKELQSRKATAGASSKTRELVCLAHCKICLPAERRRRPPIIPLLLVCHGAMDRTVYPLNEALLLIDRCLRRRVHHTIDAGTYYAEPNLQRVSKYLSSPTSTHLSQNLRVILASFGAEDLDDQILIATAEGTTMGLWKHEGGVQS
ncbi:hypothetical protein BKA70DRAFT_1229008 [Coprinopsis sp. MPI-PUGE-AT-0042]|nr:hypothetical protein BKA70DRAFT_1229008 [Coprinopsis sp. MPI-PUGE-AT-0042]